MSPRPHESLGSPQLLADCDISDAYNRKAAKDADNWVSDKKRLIDNTSTTRALRIQAQGNMPNERERQIENGAERDELASKS